MAADPTRTAVDVEDADLAVVRAVRAAVAIPPGGQAEPLLLVDGQPRPADHRRRGRPGAVRPFYQPDLDLEALDVVDQVELSLPWELRLPLDRDPAPQLKRHVSLAATSGVRRAPAWSRR